MTAAEHRKSFTTEYVDTGAEGWISIKSLLGAAVGKWYIVTVICILSVLGSIASMNLFTATYESKLIISPKDNQSLSSTPDIGSFTSVYASLFGSSTKINLLINVIQSERLASLLMSTGDFAQMIFSAQWDAERKTWKAAPGLVSSIFGGLRDLGGLDSWYPPDASDMAKYLTKNIVIAPDKESGAFIITFAHKDAKLAQHTLHTVYNMAEEILSEEEINRSTTRLKYFDQLLETSTNLNIRNTVIALADSERRNIAILQSGEHVASNLIQDATLPEKPSSPSLPLFILIGIAIGLVLSLLFVMWIHHRAPKSRR